MNQDGVFKVPIQIQMKFGVKIFNLKSLENAWTYKHFNSDVVQQALIQANCPFGTTPLQMY